MSSIAIQGNTAVQTTGTIIKATATLLDSTDGLTRISEFALSVFSMFEHFFKTLPDALSRLGNGLSTFVDVTCIVSIVKRCRDWFSADENGKRPWNKAWDSITALACLTAGQIIGFVKFLSTTLKIFELGKALLPLTIISNGLILAFSAFDLVGNAKKLTNVSQEKAKAESAQSVWAARAQSVSDRDWSALVSRQAAAWARKVVTYRQNNNAPLLAKAEAKVTLWTEAQKTIRSGVVDSNLAKTFCSKKVEQLKVIATNGNTERTKSILNVAWNVGLIALMALSSVMALIAPPVALTIATIAVAAATSGLDVTNFFTDLLMKAKQVPAVVI